MLSVHISVVMFNLCMSIESIVYNEWCMGLVNCPQVIMISNPKPDYKCIVIQPFKHTLFNSNIHEDLDLIFPIP